MARLDRRTRGSASAAIRFGLALARKAERMRAGILFVVMFSIMSATNACAQVEVTVPEAGRVKTIAKVENGILRVSNSFTRLRGTAPQCVGGCFYAAATKNKGLKFPDSRFHHYCSA